VQDDNKPGNSEKDNMQLNKELYTLGKKVTIHSPGTVANLVCGYDILGLCLHQPYDVMQVKLLDERRVIMGTTDGVDLPTDPLKNTAGKPLLQMLEKITDNIGFEVIITKNIKPGSGLGSSAASAAGAVVAANHLLGNVFTQKELVKFAMYGEEVATGVKHADNIAPCIYGGITLISCISPLEIVTIPPPDLWVTVIHPQIEVRTADARKILRKELLLKDAIVQWGNIAGLVAGFFKKDFELIGRSLKDVIIEPVRSILIPGFDEVKHNCKEAGALGGGISGSGPTIFMLSTDESTALAVEMEMKQVYQRLGIDYHTYVTTINPAGINIVEI
jgi:homoserine kinase